MIILVSKLKSLKSVVIKLEKRLKKSMKEYFFHIEELEILYSQNVSGLFSIQENILIQELENKKFSILKKEEDTWRKKSRIVWIT